mgnify:CR=1 FL=1
MSRRRAGGLVGAILVVTVGCVVVNLWLTIAPPPWYLNLIKPVDLSDPVAAGATLVANYNCRRCHRIDSWGARLAPDLAGVTQRLDGETLRAWLREAGAVRQGTPMPSPRLSDDEITAITAYLIALDRRCPSLSPSP